MKYVSQEYHALQDSRSQQKHEARSCFLLLTAMHHDLISVPLLAASARRRYESFHLARSNSLKLESSFDLVFILLACRFMFSMTWDFIQVFVNANLDFSRFNVYLPHHPFEGSRTPPPCSPAFCKTHRAAPPTHRGIGLGVKSL